MDRLAQFEKQPVPTEPAVMIATLVKSTASVLLPPVPIVTSVFQLPDGIRPLINILCELLRNSYMRYVRNPDWRRGKGKVIYIIQQICKKYKVREFINIITTQTGIPKQTAYDWLNEYREFNNKQNEPERYDDQLNPLVAQIMNTIAAERHAREGLGAVPLPPPKPGHITQTAKPTTTVTISLPKLEVTTEQRQLFYKRLGEDRPTVVAECYKTFLRIIALPISVTETDVIKEAKSALRNLGFKTTEIDVLEFDPSASLDELLRWALTKLKPERTYATTSD